MKLAFEVELASVLVVLKQTGSKCIIEYRGGAVGLILARLLILVVVGDCYRTKLDFAHTY